MTQPRLLALDWGTTSLRAYLLGEGGAILEQAALHSGVMHVPPGGFPEAFRAATGKWLQRWPELRVLASGMVGSSVGWVEAPYVACPAAPADVARALAPVPGHGLMIVPGVAQYGEGPNVMRGEETQVFGALWLRPGLGGRLVLPGTHSKWVTLEGGAISRFDTFMTGELFAVLREHSILGRFKGEPAPEAALVAFRRGVAAARRAGNVAPLLFSARALVLTGQMPPEQALDYLSGLLIGGELASALGDTPGEVTLIGDPALCARYQVALEAFGCRGAAIIDAAEATVAGLWHLAGEDA